MVLLDDIFEVLKAATRLDETGVNRIEAATKYYEAIYLMKQYLTSTPHTTQEAPKRRLVQEKIKHYENVAAKLLADDRSTAQSIASKPRSPMAANCFFNEDSSVIPLPPPESPRLTQSAVLSKKAAEANEKLSVAIDLDEQGDKKSAIKAYMEASEIYLGAIRIAENHEQASAFIRPMLARRLEGVLDRVQQLKQPDSANQTVMNHAKTRSGVESMTCDDTLTQEEISVLKRSSQITSGLFLPWSDDDAQQLSLRVQSMKRRPTALFTDPDGELCLSKEQRKHFFRYARPAEIVQQRQQRGVKQGAPTLIKSITPYSIRQRCVTDCSFIASLCICAAFERRFRKRLITSIIYPQDKNGIPMYNPEGKYMVKLWLNGVGRQVVVDDRLPIDRNSNLLCSHTMGPKSQLELWVSVIEKAYMKLCGGYDFPGSNSGVDLFSLTGWIPERIFFAKADGSAAKDFETPPERAWDRLFSANSFGDCLITVSTTREMTDSQADGLGLVTGHAYAVLDVIQTKNGTKLLLLKNPWASKGWKGRFSRYDKSSWRDPSFRNEVGYNPDLAPNEDDGVFWIMWEDVLTYFRNLQLSWNPALFPYRVTRHDFWPASLGPSVDTFNVGDNPQYVMALSKEAITKKATIWVLISRHVEKQEQAGCEVTDFLTIHMMKNSSKKERIFYPHGKKSLVVGAYTNNPHVLNELPHVRELSSSWTSMCSGGPVGSHEFFRNPMWVITFSEDSTVQLRCYTAKTFAVNVMLLDIKHADGNSRDYRRSSLRGKPKVDSGNYRFGFAVTEREHISAGTYTLVVSTFEAGQHGVFNVKICSSTKVKIGEVQ